MSSGFGLSTGRRKELRPQDAAGYLLLLCLAILSPRRNGLLETAKHILLILSALFPIVNPLGGSPVFLALTRHYPASARRALARKVAMNSFVLLIAFFLSWHAHPALLRHFYSCGASRRRPGRDFQRVGHAEAKGRAGPWARCPEKGGPGRYFP